MTFLIILLLTVVPQQAAPSSVQDKRDAAVSNADLIKTLELQADTLRMEIVRLRSQVTRLTQNLKTAQQRLRTAKRRLRHRPVSGLTLEESERLQNALDAVTGARSELQQTQINLSETNERLATVTAQIKLLREMPK